MEVVLSVIDGPHCGQNFAFRDHDTFIVGRASYAHFRLPQKDKQFSRVHFLIEVNPPHCRLMDAGSTNGTFVNGHRVTTTDLRDADLIRGGNTVIRVSVGSFDAIADRSTIAPRRLGHEPSAASDMAGAITEGASSSATPSSVAAISPAELLPPDYGERILRQPQSIAGYQIVEELGRGSMGIVYLAICEADSSVVALKLIAPDAASSEHECQQFLREASILKQLAHPHIVSFREMGISQGHLYFAMQFVRGMDAGTLLRGRPDPLPISRATRIVCQVLEALEYAHAKGFVHRDIKPENLLITNDAGREIVKVLDFGLARTYQASRVSGLTMTGDVGGTTPFMAPEQITRYRESLPSVDQYSAAATLYFLLTKKFVYDFPRDVGRQIAMILQEDPMPIHKRQPDLPLGLAAAIDRGLARQVSDRFPDVAEMRKSLVPFCRLP